MGDLTKGYTFTAGEVVTPSKLHTLVESAEIVAGSVGTAELADGSVTTAKLASGVAITASQVSVASGAVLVGNGSSVGTSVTVDTATINTSATFGVKAAGIGTTQLADSGVTTAKIADSNVTTAKIADGNVTLAKLANVATSTVIGRSTSGTGVPESLTLSSELGISSGQLKINRATGTLAVPSVGAAATEVSHGLGATPKFVEWYLECVSDDTSVGYRANSGDGTPDRIPGAYCFSAAFAPAVTTYVNGTKVGFQRYQQTSEFDVYKRTNPNAGMYIDINANLASKWQIRWFAEL